MANVDIRLGHKDTAFFNANPTLVLEDGQCMFISDGANQGQYKIGDGVTALSALTFYGGSTSSGLDVGTSVIANATNGYILYNNNGVLGNLATTGSGDVVLATSPTFVTDITTPKVIGGTGTASKLTHTGSTNATPTLTGIAHEFYVGNNGADEALRILHNGRVGLNTNPTYDFCVNGHDTVNDGILISSTTYINVPNPGTVSNVTLMTGRGFNMATDSTVLTGSYVPTLGIGLASNRSGALLGIKNTSASGYSILIEDGNMGVFTTNPYTALQVAGNITSTWANSQFGTWYQDGSQYKMGFNTVIAQRQLNLHAYTDDTGGYITFSTGSVGSPFVNLRINPAQTSGALVNYDFTNPTSTNLTLSTNIPNFKVTGSNKQWATGALATQYFNYFSANTVSFVGASTATDVYSMYVDAPIQGTNATVTNALGFGTNGMVNIGSATTTSQRLVRIGQDTAWIDIGSQAGSTARAAIYLNQTTPSTTNFALSAHQTAGQTYVNGSGGVAILYNGGIQVTYSNLSMSFGDGLSSYNLNFTSSAGSKLGTATTQKIGFWNTTPIVQPTTAVSAATFVANTSGIVDDTATFDGYTIGQIVKALRNTGLLA